MDTTYTRHLVLLVVMIVSTVCRPTTMGEGINFSIDAKLTATASSNSTDVSEPVPQTTDLSKIVNTILALGALLLTAMTYYILMTYTLKLSDEVNFPSGCLEPNLSAILSMTWPERYMETTEDEESQEDEQVQDKSESQGKSESGNKNETPPWVLFFPEETSYRLKSTRPMETKNGIVYDVRGHNSFAEPRRLSAAQTENSQPKPVPIRVRSSSPAMKTVVQISIWNHITVWLILAMIFNTLVYNGLFNNRTNDDSVIRLLLVLVYAIANIFIQRRTSTLLYRNFTFAAFQACWTIVCNTFVSFPGKWLSEPPKRPTREPWPVPGYAQQEPDLNLKTLNLELFGKAKQSKVYRLLPAADWLLSTANRGLASLLSKGPDTPSPEHFHRGERWKSLVHKTSPGPDRDLFAFVNTQRDAKIKEYEKSTESALEKMLANVAVMLGICLATGLAPWTSAVKNDSTTAQLGSYALLLSVSTGLLALISIHSQMTNATESASTLLLLQEKTIEAAFGDEDEVFIRTFSLRDKPQTGFSDGIGARALSGRRPLSEMRLLNLASRWQLLPCLLFGPATLFIPWR